MSRRRGELSFRVAGVLGAALLQGLFRTTRLDRSGHEPFLQLRREGGHVIFVFWHGQLLPLLYHHRDEGVVVLVSEHADGEYVTRVIERLGSGTARGSSTRGGTRGLKGLIRAAREGHDLAVTPDGPGGPARTFKPGALLAAAVTGLPIVPVAAGASSAWHARSWDRFLIPRPLSRIYLRYGAPYWIERDAGEEALGRHALVLERTLNELTERARRGGSGARTDPHEARA